MYMVVRLVLYLEFGRRVFEGGSEVDGLRGVVIGDTTEIQVFKQTGPKIEIYFFNISYMRKHRPKKTSCNIDTQDEYNNVHSHET